jgi:hypothetical protein
MAQLFDYTDEVKRLITEMYEPADVTDKEFEYTTGDITNNLQCILPRKAVDEHMVYEVMTELGFKPQEKNPLEYYWYFKRKKD